MFPFKKQVGWKPFVKTKSNSKNNVVLYQHRIWCIFLGGMVVLGGLGGAASFVIRQTNQNIDNRLSIEYEPVFYDPSELLARSKRELGSIEPIKLTLHTKTRVFHLNLEKDGATFHPELEIENSQGPYSSYDKGNVYQGHLEDDPGSSVEGLITSEGHFDGVISTSEGDTYHVEPSSRYEHPHNGRAPGVMYTKESAVQALPQESPRLSCHSSHPNAAAAVAVGSNHSMLHASKRSKRSPIDPRRRTCLLYLQADHLFYSHFGSEEAVINMMARHIQRVNEIYRGTDFDGDGSPDAISFMIKRIKVHTKNATAAPDYKYNGDFEVIKFLEKFSEGDYESFCLAYMFTFRDFSGGTLGLAWTGDLKNAGGVCERKGHFRGGLKSLNTGIITLLNYGKVVLPAVSYVTLAHEIGHNFGAPHDPESDKECVPGGRDGNFIMYARATGGDQKNNQRFSPCSLRSIQPVLQTKARGPHGCFSEPQRGVCGNREVEDGEQCDCGWEEDCSEDCCWPMRLKHPKGETPCTLKPTKECSPSQGPCCTQSCELRAGNKCREDNGCRHTQYCDGLVATCPPSLHKPNKTVCLDGQNVCFMGECTGSICLAYGLESCQCSTQAWDSSSKLCELCCKKPGDGPCLSSWALNEAPYDVPDLYAKPGSPCNNYTGYCDAYKSCREVDPSGPLATLRNLLLADEGLSAIADWVDSHWYAVVSFVLLLIVMMVLTAKLCGKQAKKKLRKITVQHSNVDAIQVERSYWDEAGEHVVHPAAVRKKIPLRKKIREKRGGGVGRAAAAAAKSQSQSGPGGVASTSIPPGPKSPIKASKTGSLWRNKRKGERSRGVPQKTENAAGGVAQTFDLVQLHTPPTSANSDGAKKPIYPVLSEGAGPSAGAAAAGAAASSSSTPVNHHYEAKTVILPNVGRKKRSTPQSQNGPLTLHHGRAAGPQQARRSGEEGGSGSKHRPTPSSAKKAARVKRGKASDQENKPVSDKPKKSFQIVYTPPFSVQVLTQRKKTEEPPKSGVANVGGPGKKPLSPIFELPLPPIPTTTATITMEGTTAPVQAAIPKPQPSGSKAGSSSGKPKNSSSGPSTSSKLKSSSSFLGRSRNKKRKGELKVLIPPPNLQDDEQETPTPGT